MLCDHRPMARPIIDPETPPPGPFRPEFWRSPLRGPWLTAVLGLVLLIGLPVVIITGLLSNDAYQPGLGANALGRHTGGLLDLYLFGWPTEPAWLYAVSQGLHVTIGLAVVPVVLAKLWSVIPRLFEWPPVHSPAHALERLSLALLVGGALFELVTGILNIQYWYAFPFFFTQAHYYGAWVFIAAFVVHVALKLGTMRRSLRTRGAVLDAAAGPGTNAGGAALAAHRSRAGDNVAADPARNGDGRIGAAVPAGLRAVRGWPVSSPRLPAPAGSDTAGSAWLSGQQDVGGVGDRAACGGLGLAAGGARQALAVALARAATRPSAAHLRPPDRLRGGMVDHATLERRAVA